MTWSWKLINQAKFEKLQSTEQMQPLDRKEWPPWASGNPNFSAAWITPMNETILTSTKQLSTSTVIASVDMERTSTKGTPLRYYRYFYAKMIDGRVFQAGPFKNIEYKHHRNDRPAWLAAYSTTSPV